MAVAAKVPEVLERVEPFKQDLSKKLHIIHGNEYEDAIFADLKESLPDGDFLEFDRETQSVEATLAALHRGVPVVAQAMFAHEFGEFEWLGYADLLVREDYDLVRGDDARLHAVKLAPEDSITAVTPGSTSRDSSYKYVVWDVKHAKKDSPKYWKQIAGYAEILEIHGLASSQPVGVVLSDRVTVRQDFHSSLEQMRASRETLFETLSLVSPQEIDASFAPVQCCSSSAVCKEIFCTFPDLCAKVRYDQDSLEQLPGGMPQQRAAFIEAGIPTTEALAAWPKGEPISGLTQAVVDKYVHWSQVIQQERKNGPFVQTVANPKTSGLPALSAGDLFFDIEWFNPLEGEELIFMFGVVDAAERFSYFLADDVDQERDAFERFVAFATANLDEHPNSHIFHYSDPEPGRLKKLAARYGVLNAEVDRLVAAMIDLKTIAKASIMPGCAGYSIKQLERYYSADSKLNRGKLVKGGDDAMFQYYEYRRFLALGQISEANAIMSVILDYNRDDCFSTKLLAEWLETLAANYE